MSCKNYNSQKLSFSKKPGFSFLTNNLGLLEFDSEEFILLSLPLGKTKNSLETKLLNKRKQPRAITTCFFHFIKTY